MVNYNKNLQDKVYLYFLLSIITIFYTQLYYTVSNEIVGDKWAYDNLFINYSAGFVRRGLLGEIFLIINKIYNVGPLDFFPKILFILYFTQLIIFFKLVYKFKKYNLFVTFLILSPSLLLFNIYEVNVVLSKDIFIAVSILIHALIVSSKTISLSKYKKILLFVIFPILTINIFIHENQIIFLPFHILLSTYFLKESKNKSKNYHLLKSYYFFLIPLIAILSSSISYEKYLIINESIKQFDATLPNQVAGNINLIIGGFIKWHFFYHDTIDFIRLFFCITLSLFLIYLVFHNLILKKIIYTNNFNINYYFYFILPTFVIFGLMLDHGRSIHLILMHMLSFYLVLEFNKLKFEKIYYSLFNNFLIKNLIYIFLIFYLFFWYLPQGGGFTGIGNFSSLFKSGLMEKFLELFLIIYNYIDLNIITLPRVNI
tara:strand:- start:966 stop:2249 length:1284 start_codon:yes stop_codon:yes gene_type:complete